VTTDRYTVGLDGEGIGRRPHKYALLTWSDARGKRAASIEDWTVGLSTARCLAFVTALPLAARPFGFFLGYDWTMILADLPNRDLYRLFRPELRATPGEGQPFSEVSWRHYRLHYLGGMMRVRNCRTRRAVTIWDVGKFFQTSFADALRKWEIAADVGAVEAMKAKRSRFSARNRTQIRAYCESECRALATLVESLNAAHERAGLPLTRWHGPGSSASVALKSMRIGDKRGKAPADVERAASAAFFGGRFEHRAIGPFDGPIYGYDIVSAYPAACVDLPCLEHASWRRVNRERQLPSRARALVRFRLAPTKTEAFWGPLPIRLPRGEIVFPRSGATGWTWDREYRAARALSPNVEFLEAWVCRTSCKCKPFSRVRDWFDERRRIGKDGRGIVIKLAINSIYGKLAQSVGVPPFASRIWAGMITSDTRARLLGAIAQDPHAVLCTATDGIYSLRPLALDVGTDLGQWEAKRAERIVLVRRGIFWTESTVRARGVGRGALPQDQREAILEALERGAPSVVLPPVTRFGGAKACVYLSRSAYRRSERYGQWYDQPVRLTFDPAPKRGPGFALYDLPDVESVPYGVAPQSVDAARLERAETLAWGAR
jgi:hypothetical protein